MSLTTVDAGLLGTQAQYTSYKNRLFNGNMVVAQRGTAFATPANLAYTLDRWLVNWAGAAPSSVNQVAGPAGYKYALRLSGGASNTGLNAQQRIESINCADLSGATVTIQANISVSSAQTIGWTLQYANAADNFSGGVTSIASGTWSATTTATVFTATVTNLPAGALNGIALLISPNNGAGLTSGTVDITGVQIEKGSTATSFDYRPYGTELALCQRYYYRVSNPGSKAYGLGAAFSATTVGFGLQFPVTMRAAPTGVEQSGVAADYAVLNSSGGAISCSAVPAFNSATNASVAWTNLTVASGLSGGNVVPIWSGGNTYYGWSAEL